MAVMCRSLSEIRDGKNGGDYGWNCRNDRIEKVGELVDF